MSTWGNEGSYSLTAVILIVGSISPSVSTTCAHSTCSTRGLECGATRQLGRLSHPPANGGDSVGRVSCRIKSGTARTTAPCPARFPSPHPSPAKGGGRLRGPPPSPGASLTQKATPGSSPGQALSRSFEASLCDAPQDEGERAGVAAVAGFRRGRARGGTRRRRG